MNVSFPRRIVLVAAMLGALGCAKSPDEGGPPGGGPDGGGNTSCTGNGSAAQPFGNHRLRYTSGSILPSGSQDDLDEAVRVAYDLWKNRYVKAGCGAGRYYVATGMNDAMTVSEAHGYGMLITAFMAGHDPEAKTVFDGMVKYFRDHPSDESDDLMAWSQSASCDNNRGADSATDGDLDIAYALLLADRQWGSGGDIDYHGEALRVIEALRRQVVDSSGSYLLLGSWVSPGTGEYNATRTSDFMPGHLRSYQAAAGGTNWSKIADEGYEMIAALQQKHAASTGLIPDFVQSPTSSPRPAGPDFLETENDGQYSYNACRDPWRLGVDYLVGGDRRGRDTVQKINTWIKGETGGDAEAIRAGYRLDGSEIRDYSDLAFTAPLGAGAMVDASNQAWLDAIWDTAAGSTENVGYYGETLKVLAMITMSGNWWAPEAAPCGGS